MAAAYKLTEDDLDVSDDDPPVIRAARNPNPQVLVAIIEECAREMQALGPNPPRHKVLQVEHDLSVNTCISGAIHGIYNSPLIAAINARLPQNISTLFQAGADPNGIKLSDLDEYSVRFIRGRNPQYNMRSYSMCPPRAKALAETRLEVPQTAPLTAGEIVARRTTFSRFWTEPELPTLRFRSKPALTALEVAASTGDIALFEQVRAAGPDESWWTADTTPSQLPADLTHSALRTSSPCHEAILAGKNDMLRHLLSLGYSPNVLPLAAPTRCLTPLMTAVALCDPPNMEAYDILSGHPATDMTIRTPVFSIHLLHFAAARLDVPLLQRLSENPATKLGSAGTTALGHTLLHVASLSRTDANANVFSEKIFNSVHDVRTLDVRRWIPIDLRRRNPANRAGLFSAADTMPLPRERTSEDTADSEAQTRTILWLLESGTQDISAKDVCGNTALHYLASAMWTNDDLIAQVRAWQGGESVWKENRNELGYTPEELWEDGKNAVHEQWKTFWMDR